MNVILKFVFLFVISTCTCFAINEDILINAIEREDANAIIQFFDENETIQLEEAQELIQKITDYYADRFGIEIFDEAFLDSMENYKSMYYLILQDYGYSIDNFLINSKDMDHQFFLTGKKSKKKQKDIPGSVVIGGIEILVGALVWIIPAPGTKQLGAVLVGDGIRRTFNGLEEVDKQNQAKIPST